MNEEWKKGYKNRKYKFEGSHFLLIKNGDFSNKSIPFDCPVCEILMRDRNDSIAFQIFECCRECMYDIAYPNKDRWEEGWRPSEEELKFVRQKRLKLPSYICKY
jgi:hypothetical protein